MDHNAHEVGFDLNPSYHRLWSHKAYQAFPPLRYLLAGIGAGTLQTPINRWARQHRAHHRYIDTVQDPYNAKKGLVWSHIGWMLFQNEVPWGKVDISDIESDPVVIWQERHYLTLMTLSGWILPGAIAHFGWNDLAGGLSKRVLSGSCWVGSLPPRDNPLVALVTFGEGYHNFHHKFPSDYRNGAKWHDFDISKWSIWLWEKAGLASHVKRISVCEIEEARRDMVKRPSGDDVKIPVIEWEKFVEDVRDGQSLLAIAGFVYDVTDFVDEHSGSASFINDACGKDATTMFHGGIYKHSSHAHNLLRKLRVAIIRGGGEVDNSHELTDHKFVVLR